MGLLRTSVLACALLALVASTGAHAGERAEDRAVLDTEVGRQVYRELREAYAAHAQPDFERAVRALSSAEAEQRRFGAEYLLALFRQTAWDERHGLTPPSRGWSIGGSGPEDEGARIRWRAADAFMRTPPPEHAVEALPAALWLYETDGIPANRLAGMRVLALVPTPESDAAVARALAGPDDNPAVLALALWAARVRRMEASGEAIRALCGDHRLKVRDAARETARALGLEDLPDYDPTVRLSPVLERRLRGVLACLASAVPSEASWAWVEHVASKGAEEPDRAPHEFGAWVLERTDASTRVVDWFGTARTLSSEQWRVLSEPLKASAERLVKLRESFLATEDLDLRRAVREAVGIDHASIGSGDPWTGSLPEMLVAAWSFERGDPATASNLLLTILEAWADEGSAFRAWRDELAVRVEEEMLDAFVGRNYAGALVLARHLATPAFDGYWNQQWAIDLVEQLPRRQDDFTTLRLPSEEEWTSLRAKLSRAEQVRYLRDRLRLIHDVHLNFPGGVSWEQEQFDVPLLEAWQSGNGAGGSRPEPRRLVNPYVELRRMDLSCDEAVELVPLLRSSDFILAYHRARFLPRHPVALHRVRWLAASLLNEVAGEKLVDANALESDDATVREQVLAHATRWCAEHGPRRRRSDRFEATVLESADWPEATRALLALDALDRARAGSAALERARRDAVHRADLLRFLALRVGPHAPEDLKTWAADPDAAVALWASLALLKRDGAAAHADLAGILPALKAGEPPLLLDWLLDDLLTLGEGEVRVWLRSLITADHGAPTQPTTLLLQRLLLAGEPAARDRLLAQLEGNAPLPLDSAGGPFQQNDELPQVMGPQALALRISRWGGFWPENAWTLSDEQAAALFAQAKSWVKDTADRVAKGQPVAVTREEPAAPLGPWRPPGGQWVLQTR